MGSAEYKRNYKEKPRQMWQAPFKSVEDFTILAEEGYIPSDELDASAEELVEEYEGMKDV